MTAAVFNITIEQKSTYRQSLVLYTDDAQTLPANLVGYSARLDIKLTPTSPTTILSLTTSNGGIVIDGINGTISILATDEQTRTLKFAQAVYDLVLESSTGEVYRIVKGIVQLSLGVTD